MPQQQAQQYFKQLIAGVVSCIYCKSTYLTPSTWEGGRVPPLVALFDIHVVVIVSLFNFPRNIFTNRV